MLPPLATEPREVLYGLSGAYLDAYNAVVQPQHKLSISVYTLRRWAAQLGGTGFWLLVTLQQQMYKNGRGQCVVSRDVLAREAGVGEVTVHRYLHGEQYQTSGLRHFVRQRKNNSRMWSKKIGKMVQPVAQYDVLIDAPLAPTDQHGLAQYLVEHGGATDQEVTPALERLIATRSLTDVLALLDEHAKRFDLPAEWKEDTFLPTVTDVVNALGVNVGGNGSGTKFMDLCSRVQRHIVAWDWVGQKYFFEKWLPVLGPTLALAIVKMRSMCFWNEHELRDEVEIRVSDLAAMVSCTGQRLRQLLCLPEAREFLEEISVGTKHYPSTFKVKLIEPIAQADMSLYQSLLNGAEVTSTGQLGFELAPAMGKSDPISDTSELVNLLSACPQRRQG